MKTNRHIRIFVLIDALGWTYVENDPFLQDLLPFRQPLRTVLGFSSGAIPTILTGVFPSQNGHWNLFYYDPKTSPFRWLKYFSFVPNFILDHRVSRKILKEMGRRVLGLGPSFEPCVNPHLLRWFNWVEKKNIYGPKGISGAQSIFDTLDQQSTPYKVYSYHTLKDEQILELAKKDLRAGEADFFFIYLSEMDEFLHHHCGHTDQIEQKLRWYEGQLRDLYRIAAELDPDFETAVFSDHGMTPVQKDYDLVREIDSLGFQMPQDYVAVYDSTMARFWFFDEKAREIISAELRSKTCGRLITDAEQEKLGIFFPDRKYGELIFLLEPGYILAHSDFNGPRWSPTGMHGYDPSDRYSDAIFLTNKRPLFPLTTIADVYAVMNPKKTVTEMQVK